MTKEITRAIVLQEMQDKLKLRELESEVFSFSERVVPVYNIEQHLGIRSIDRKTVSITSAVGFLFFTVPQTQRWWLKAYNVMFLGAGAITVSGVYFQRGKTAQDFMYMDLKAAQDVSYLVVLNPPVLLDPGDTIHINIDGYTSTQDLKLHIDVEKEEIR